MKIEVRERMGKTLEEILSPDDNLVFRCVDCGTFLLPREIHILKRRVRLPNGDGTFETIELCPACHPNPSLLRKEAFLQSSTFVMLDRFKFELTRRYEALGIVPPEDAPFLAN